MGKNGTCTNVCLIEGVRLIWSALNTGLTVYPTAPLCFFFCNRLIGLKHSICIAKVTNLLQILSFKYIGTTRYIETF